MLVWTQENSGPRFCSLSASPIARVSYEKKQYLTSEVGDLDPSQVLSSQNLETSTILLEA